MVWEFDSIVNISHQCMVYVPEYQASVNILWHFKYCTQCSWMIGEFAAIYPQFDSYMYIITRVQCTWNYHRMISDLRGFETV